MKMYNIPYAGTTVTYPQFIYVNSLKVKNSTPIKKITTIGYVKVSW